MKILFAGGGTGGHITPIIAIAREVRRIYPSNKVQLYFIGPRDDFGDLFLSQEDIIVKNIFAGKVRRFYSPLSVLQNVFDVLFKIPIGIIQAFGHIFSYRNSWLDTRSSDIPSRIRHCAWNCK